MPHLRTLLVSVIVLGVFGLAYIYADPVQWYECVTTNAQPSNYCIPGDKIVCALYNSPGHGWVPGTPPPKHALVISPAAPIVGKCVGKWWFTYTCEKSFPCESVCEFCGARATKATSVGVNECVSP